MLSKGFGKFDMLRNMAARESIVAGIEVEAKGVVKVKERAGILKIAEVRILELRGRFLTLSQATKGTKLRPQHDKQIIKQSLSEAGGTKIRPKFNPADDTRYMNTAGGCRGDLAASSVFIKVFDLASATVSLGKKQSFELVELESGKQHSFKCASRQDAEEWIARLNRAIISASTCNEQQVQLEDFEPILVLGKGHFGIVKLVRHHKSGALFALKEMHEASPPNKKQAQATRGSRKGILSSVLGITSGHKNNSAGENTRRISPLMRKQISERLILGELSQSGNDFVAQMEYAFRANNSLFLALEFTPGGDLWTLIRAAKQLDLESTRSIVSQMVVTINSLHAIGIVHRDIKLENIMLDRAGNIKLIDFGLSKILTPRRKIDPSDKVEYGFTFTSCGTSYYYAPEVVKGGGHTLAVDWWQLGCLVFELLVGKPAFYASNQASVFAKIMSSASASKSATQPDQWPYLLNKALQSNSRNYEHKSLIPHAVDLCHSLLAHDVSKRLGSDGVCEIKSHPFFQGVNWYKVEACEASPSKRLQEYVSDAGSIMETLSTEGSDLESALFQLTKYFKDATDLKGNKLSSSSSSSSKNGIKFQKSNQSSGAVSKSSSAARAETASTVPDPLLGFEYSRSEPPFLRTPV